MQGLPFGPQNMPYYGQQPPTAPFMQPPPQPPMVQTPVQQAAQQPQQGDIWSDIQTFSRTPQGQQALLAFANSAMQASMNPQTGGGAGFIGAMGSGMQGYKAAEAHQEEKAWRDETRTAQRKEWKQKEITDPLEIRKLTAQIATLEAPKEGYLKPGKVLHLGANMADGREATVDKMYLGGDITDVKNENVFRTIGIKVNYTTPKDTTPTARENAKDAMSLRKEFNARPEIKEYNLIQPKIVAMEKALAESQRTGKYIATDQAMITLFNKLTDPNSVVRESEYARMATNMPLVNAIAGKAYKVLSGGAGLTADERSQIVEMAKLMKQAYQDVFDQTATEYEEYATGTGVNPELVIGKTRRTSQAVRITSDAEYNALKPGTMYISPDGQTRRKK